MNESEWRESIDPAAMIHWLARQGHSDALWEFTVACCRRVWNDLPGETFRRVVEHFEEVGVHDIEQVLHEASVSLGRLERRLRGATSDAEQSRLNRQIGFGRMVLAFEYQDAAEAAISISDDLLAWSDDPDRERRSQTELLRQSARDVFHQNDLDDIV